MKFDLVIVVGVDHAAESVERRWEAVVGALRTLDLAPLLREFQHPSAHMVRSAPGRQVNARSSEFARPRQNVFSAS